MKSKQRNWDKKLVRCMVLYLRGHSITDIGLILGSEPRTVITKLACAQRKIDAGLLQIPAGDYLFERYEV